LLHIPILKGRGFDATDSRSSPQVVVVSEALAQSVWPGENAVGKQIEMSSGHSAEVAGVVGNVRAAGLDAEFARTVYVPTTQASFNFMTVLVKTRNEPSAVAPTIRRLVRELDPSLPLHHVRTLDAIVSGSVAQQRFQVCLISAFSFLMFALAVVGIYGVTAYAVSERTNELGIRAALGARASDIRGMVLRDGIRLAVIGIVIGAVGAAAVSGVLTRFVFQIGAIDYVAFAAAPIILGGAAMLATWIPAHRAAQIDPMRALRVD
jgi:putative ABC transport system permease protein